MVVSFRPWRSTKSVLGFRQGVLESSAWTGFSGGSPVLSHHPAWPLAMGWTKAVGGAGQGMAV